MNKLISERNAALSIMVILATMMLFHLAILSGIIPYNIVWGGRLTSKEDMVRFETISLLANCIMVVLTAIRGGFLTLHLPTILHRVIFVLMTLLFLLNTAGNLASNNKWEAGIFTPMTLLLSFLCLRLAIAPAKKKAVKQ